MSNLKEFFSNPNLYEAITNSLLLSVLSVVLSLILGVYLAYLIHSYRIKLKSFLSAFILLPIATPPIIGTVAFVYLISDNGLIIKLVNNYFSFIKINPIQGWTAILLIHLYSFYPFFFLFSSASLKKLDSNITDASYSLGASKFKTLFKIIIPYLYPAIISSSVIVFMASMASFSAPFIFGDNSRFLTTEIYNSKINGDMQFSSLLSIVLTFISLIGLYFFTKFRNLNENTSSSKGTIRLLSESGKSKLNLINKFFISSVIIFISLPLITLIYLSFIPEGALLRNIFNESLTLQNYIKLFSEEGIYKPFLNSFYMALITVIICLLLGTLSSLRISEGKNKFNKLIEIFISLPYGIPGTVIAIMLILSFNSFNIFTFTSIIGTFIILPLAYTIRNIPVYTQSVLSGIKNFDTNLRDASYSLGAGKSKTFFKLTLPLLLPSIINGSLLVFINSMGEFVSTILLYTYNTRTVSIEIYSQLRMYNTGIGAVYGVLLFLIVILTVYLSRKYINERISV
ncbi:MAG: iron ABC transporter permease [Ignavibacteria bacterium]|nr:iron ABC transporter permease [Ignavibacteria bacterium]